VRGKVVDRPDERHLIPNQHSQLTRKPMIGARSRDSTLSIIQLRIEHMARPPHPQQTEALAWIRECVDQLGDQGYTVAKAKYPHIPQPTFWRWTQTVRGELMMTPPPSVPAALPAPATGGVEVNDPATSPLDFFESELGQMRRDIAALRLHATVVDQGGNVRLRNPLLLIQATRLRNQMMTLFVQRQEAAVGAERMAQYRELITGAIEHVLQEGRDPAEKAVLRRLSNAMRDADRQWKSVAHIVDPRKASAAAEAGA
jgi:hypothetical protein